MSYEEVLTEVVSQYVSGDVYPEVGPGDSGGGDQPLLPDDHRLQGARRREPLERGDPGDGPLRRPRALEERKAEWEERTAELERRGLARADGVASFEEAERRTLLSVVDSAGAEHLYEMDYLREGIGWRGLSQRDPLVEYKREGFDIFQEMERGLKEDYVTYIYRIENVMLREEEMQQLSYSGGRSRTSGRGPRSSEGRDRTQRPCRA